MQKYLVRRMLLASLAVVGATLIAFAAIRLIPGDVVDLILGTKSTPQAESALRNRLGLDQPPLQQYFSWLAGLFKGELGNSLRTQESVMDMMRQRLPVTIELTLLSTVIAVIIGLPAGLITAVRQYSLLDNVLTMVAMLGVSMPEFWLGTLLPLLFAVTWRLLPSGGLLPGFFDDPVNNLKRMLMPALSLGLPSASVYFRMMRSSMLEVIRSEYMTTAYSKGLKEQTVILVHALRNALIPVVTVTGLEMTYLLGGSFIIETIFGLPGLGRATVQSIGMRDFTVLQGCLLVYSILVVVVSLTGDVIYAWLDPRIRYD